MNSKTIKPILLFCCLTIIYGASAQYAPPVGQSGSTAFSMNSNQFIGWATNCIVERGWQDIADTSLGRVTYGNDSYGVGFPNPEVVSLGDGGIATLTFNTPISNKDGFDFAVFENSFDDSFLELAFVEVSSNGVDFVRFPSVSLTNTTTQVGTFGTVDATKIYNLAGKYRGRYGTPFDLEELKDAANINVDSIIYIRVIDVIGSIDSASTFDSQGNIINDPYPTAFETSGFDLDAIGILDPSIVPILSLEDVEITPSILSSNLVRKGDNIILKKSCFIYSITGKQIGFFEKGAIQNVDWSKGTYIAHNGINTQKLVIY